MTLSKWMPWFVVPLIFFYIAGESPSWAWFPDFLSDKLQILVNNDALALPKGFITLPSGKNWDPTVGQVIILIGVLILAVELFKSAQDTRGSVVDHMLSILVFIFYFAFFLSKPWAKSDVFVLIGAMSFLDVVTGFTITIAIARRDMVISH